MAIGIENEDLVRLLIDEYGMLKGTWKRERLGMQLEIYEKYKGKKLTEEDLVNYFEKKEIKSDEIKKLWIKAMNLELISLGAKTDTHARPSH